MDSVHPENSADQSSEETKSLSNSNYFCRTCSLMLSESTTSKDHERHCIVTIDDCANHCKLKLHELLSQNEIAEKNLIKTSTIATDSREKLHVVSKTQLEVDFFACFEKAMRECESDFDSKSVECVDYVKEIEMQKRKADLSIDDVKEKQKIIRNLLSKPDNQLVPEMEKLSSDGSLFSSNEKLTFLYPTQKIEQLKDSIAEDKEELTKELCELIRKHVKSFNLKQSLASVELPSTRGLNCGASLFRSFVRPDTKMASCNSFICFGYLDGNSTIVLEFV